MRRRVFLLEPIWHEPSVLEIGESGAGPEVEGPAATDLVQDRGRRALREAPNDPATGGLERHLNPQGSKRRRLAQQRGPVQADPIEVFHRVEAAPDPVLPGVHVHLNGRIDAEHARERRGRLVELVPAPRPAGAEQITAVPHPALDGGRRAAGDVRIDSIESVVVGQPTRRDVLLGEHVDQVLVVRERQVGGTPLQHGDVAPWLP